MFQETLLESSSTAFGRKRWPMAAAFLLETLVAGIVVAVPLLSTGIIPVSAHVPIIAPLQSIKLATRPANPPPSGSTDGAHYDSARIVTFQSRPNRFYAGRAQQERHNPGPILSWDVPGPSGPNLIGNVEPPRPMPPKRERIRLSMLSEAQLINKVEPVYPHIAQLAGIAGSVKLHAIIGKDGTVQSLSLISGQPILAAAALEAVAQWRYRPYLLNGEPAEVETFITVNFRKAGR